MTSQLRALLPPRRVDDVTTSLSSRWSGRLTQFAPGLTLVAGVTASVIVVGRFVPMVSPLLIAIVVGAVISNVATLPQCVQPGMTFSAKKLLRLGVALLGLQLVFSDVVGLGVGMIAVVIAVVVLGIGGTMFAGHLLGLDWTQRFLIACGFSICGAAAVAAVDGVVDADEEEVLTAIALVVVFGTAMIPLVPLLSNMIGLTDTESGLWAGGSIHEVAQVVATGGAIGGGALAVAVVVKLARVIMLAPVIAVASARQRRLNRYADDARRPPLVPMFVLAFLACMALRTTGVIPDGVLAGAKLGQTVLLTAAMFALGAGVKISALRKVGVRPALLAVVSTAWVAAIALTGVLLVG